jgi:hypothetical protein
MKETQECHAEIGANKYSSWFCGAIFKFLSTYFIAILPYGLSITLIVSPCHQIVVNHPRSF